METKKEPEAKKAAPSKEKEEEKKTEAKKEEPKKTAQANIMSFFRKK